MIEIRDLTFRAGDFQVRSVSLDVANGEYFVLLGPNGSGKTLLISCLCGLLRAESGRILIDGQDVTHAEPRLRRIGYVPQDYGLFPHLNVAKNVTFALRAAGHSRAAALVKAGPLIEKLRLGHLLDLHAVHFARVERRDTNGTVTFADWDAANTYVSASVTRGDLGGRLPHFDGALDCTLIVSVFVAETAP